ncbi:hypothetical protein [Lentzea guizhouensis]|nr:hypothetical protein [Lentzea guizhouensis]
MRSAPLTAQPSDLMPDPAWADLALGVAGLAAVVAVVVVLIVRRKR